MVSPAQEAMANCSRGPRFLEAYRRVTSNGRFIPEIDGLRFIAISLVFVFHLRGDILRHSAAPYAASLATSRLFLLTGVLNVGVPLFFVISGFILSLPFAEARRSLRKPVSLKHYFARRLFRLEPPYVLCLVILFLLKVAGGRGMATTLFPHLIASCFYLHNAIYSVPSDINFVAWSLEIEIQFYILVPALALVFTIASDSMRRSVLVAAVLLATGLSGCAMSQPRLQLSLLGYLQFFIAGFLLTEVCLDQTKRTKTWLWDLVWTTGWLLLLGSLVYGDRWSAWLAPWVILLLFVSAFLGTITNRVVTSPWVTTVGGMCYSIYLFHNYAIAALGFLTQRLGQGSPFAVRLLIQIGLMAPIVCAISAVYFRLIERPCMNPDWPRLLRLARPDLRSLLFVARSGR